MTFKESKLAVLFWIGVLAVGGVLLVRHQRKMALDTTQAGPAPGHSDKGSVAKQAPPVKRNFNPVEICTDAMQPYQVIDHSDDVTLDHFDIPLQEGCFGKLILPPKNWYRWRSQNANPDDGSGWVSFLITNQVAEAPNDMNRTVPVTANNSFRVQGKGTVRILKSQ